MSRVARADEILWDVEEEHLDEAEFLVERFGSSFEMPHYNLADLARGPERRSLAHLDALAVAGPVVAERLLDAALEDPATPPFRAAAALCALFLGPDLERALAALARLEPAKPELTDAAAVALTLCPRPELDAHLGRRLASAGRNESLCLLRACALRGADPGPFAAVALASGDTPLATAAAAAARWGDWRELSPGLDAAVHADDPALRRAAVETGLIWGSQLAWDTALRLAADPASEPESLAWLALCGDERNESLLHRALEAKETRGAALWALGFTGRTSAIDACLPLLEDEEVGALAAEAIAAIAGLSRGHPALWQSAAEQSETSASEPLPELEEDLAQDLAPSPADRLPVPAPDAFRAWWHVEQSGFRSGERYLAGKPLSHAVLCESLREGPLRRRHMLALELAIRTRGAQCVPTRASSARQRDSVARLPALPHLDFWCSFERLA